MTCWLLELPGRYRSLYLHTAESDTSIGFTFLAAEAKRFATREAAQADCVRLNGALGAQPVEHIFD